MHIFIYLFHLPYLVSHVTNRGAPFCIMIFVLPFFFISVTDKSKYLHRFHATSLMSLRVSD